MTEASETAAERHDRVVSERYKRWAEEGRSWQYDGPILRNSFAGVLDRFDWGPLETIVWIATRDERAIQGALGWMAYRDDPLDIKTRHHQGQGAQVVLRSTLPLDVADHHSGCPRALSHAECTCEELGRQRYCRCPDRLHTAINTCVCTRDAVRAFIEAFRSDLVVRGRRDGEVEFANVPPEKRIGAALQYDHPGGLRILSTFADLRIPVGEIKRRWPAGFEDRPLARRETAVPGEEEDGRGDQGKKISCLTEFAERAKRGKTKWPKIEEARWIAGLSHTACGNVESVGKWIRPFYEHLWSDGAFVPGAVPAIIAEVNAVLEEGRQKRVGAAQNRKTRAGLK